MTVYVDDVRHPFGRMVMCHMWADTLDELHAMADRIGIARRWFQTPPKASWDHYDISIGKKALALQYGAVLTDKYGPIDFLARREGRISKVLLIDELRHPEYWKLLE